jgi:putative tributyrin esterase
VSRRRLLILFTVAVLVSFASGAAVVVARNSARPRKPSPARTVSVRCSSPALGGQLPARVYLPARYRSSGGHYPVVYFLHGLPANPTSYEYQAFVAAALTAGRRRAIVVTPQGARSPGSDPEYLDWRSTENWPQAIAHDLVGCIDRRFHTIRNRDGRILAGLSAGAYGAANIGLRNLATFGAVEAWSGYFQATDPSGYHVLNLGSASANAAASVPTGAALGQELARYPAAIAFYIGAQDTRFANDNRQFSQELKSGHIPHVFRIYRGGHQMSLWKGHATAWLDAALDALASARHADGHVIAHRLAVIAGRAIDH